MVRGWPPRKGMEFYLYFLPASLSIGISKISRDRHQARCLKKEQPSLALSEAKVYFADRAVQRNIPKESVKPCFPLTFLVL